MEIDIEIEIEIDIDIEIKIEIDNSNYKENQPLSYYIHLALIISKTNHFPIINI